MTKERIASSLARPPAFRITCASPSARPANLAGSSRASMHVRTAKPRAGGRASLPLSPKLEAYDSLDLSTSERIRLIGKLLKIPPLALPRARASACKYTCGYVRFSPDSLLYFRRDQGNRFARRQELLRMIERGAFVRSTSWRCDKC